MTPAKMSCEEDLLFINKYFFKIFFAHTDNFCLRDCQPSANKRENLSSLTCENWLFAFIMETRERYFLS